MIEKVYIDELKEFLILAKRNTYAGDGVRSKSKCILSKNYLFENENYRYEDQYFGEYLDVGEEIVWYNQIPIWGMGYRGGMLDKYRKDVSIRKATFALLSKALMISLPEFPARGPKVYEADGIKYVNNFTGTICDFVGREEIYYRGILVYKRDYIGGLIYGKNNPEMICIE